jgi:multimeric flavodoxin WrbA
MATVLAILCSARRNGYTAGVLAAAAEGAGSVGGVRVDLVRLHDFDFGPCRSCFACIRDEQHVCAQTDAFGRGGELFRRLSEANGLLVGDPVHNWGPSAACHLLIERCYPFLWSGRLNGLPFASISCASNQGMHRLANRWICKWAFGYGMLYIGGVPAHTAYLERAKREARALGERLGRAALEDEASGRRAMTDEERFLAYMDSPWPTLDPYLDNLTHGTMTWEGSMIKEALDAGTFTRPEARELLSEAGRLLVETLQARAKGDLVAANKLLVQCSAHWTNATWQQFLEEDVIGAKQPEAYRPLSRDAQAGED